MEEHQPAIRLAPMLQLREAVDADDDWTGLTDSKARKKRQNRLHQRAHRRRKAIQAQLGDPGQYDRAVVNIQGDQLPYAQLTPRSSTCQRWQRTSDQSGQLISNTRPYYWDKAGDTLAYSAQSLLQVLDTLSYLTPVSTRQEQGVNNPVPNPTSGQHKIIPPVIPYITPKATHLPVSPVTFPLAPDHRLLIVVQYNVLRASLVNMSILALEDHISFDCGAVFTIPFPRPSSTDIPHSLLPTPLQLSIPHDPWVDLIPMRRVRDNVLLNYGTFDEDDLCADFVGGLYEGFHDVENRGMVIWGEPWSEDGWEITEGFAAKWKFLLKGCHELVEVTNRFREERGDERLVIEV